MLLEPASSLAATVPRDGGSVAEWGVSGTRVRWFGPAEGQASRPNRDRPRTAENRGRGGEGAYPAPQPRRRAAQPADQGDGRYVDFGGRPHVLATRAGLLRAARPTRGVGRPAPRRAVRGPAR